ncbi:hypothetical protein [Dermatobacter hominis]|uniref:hypothetical protein n=1 Tax=Dermatobacter hominis TaxID=2884263 RepID=UPI001D11284F|nr:hypothetical protein [Dermatobacter hominis]UDY34134.1 hypothetical protein LH044_12355 [Dermatobacter hominis]
MIATLLGTSLGGVVGVLAQDDGGGTLFLGDDFFPWIVLALGAAMVVGNLLALVRPPADGGPPPVGRAVTMIVLGAVAAVWGIASLVS